MLPRLTLTIVVPRYCSNGFSGVAASRLLIKPIGHSGDPNRRIQPAFGLRASTSASTSCLRNWVIARCVSCDDANGPTITRWRVAPLDSVTVAVSVFQPACASVARNRSASSLLVNDPPAAETLVRTVGDRRWTRFRFRRIGTVGARGDLLVRQPLEEFESGHRRRVAQPARAVRGDGTAAPPLRQQRTRQRERDAERDARAEASPMESRLALSRTVARFASQGTLVPRSVRKSCAITDPPLRLRAS